MAKPPKAYTVETITHVDATRKNIPSAEHQSVMEEAQQSPVRVAYERRNRDLDPQLVWRGKDEQDWSDLVVHAQPLYIQEKIHPKVLIDDLRKQTTTSQPPATQLDLFADFNGLPSEGARTEFYQHDGHWSNRMILGDSLQVMASLAEREGLRGKVQCIYLDPPYGIKFNSNFQWSTTSRDVKDGNAGHITREPEQVKAFRDTWRDGIHSYLTYLRDRLTVARDLLTESGSIFVQIGDGNLHRVKTLMDEIFGDENSVAIIAYNTTSGQTSDFLANPKDYLLWYAKNTDHLKFRQLFHERQFDAANPGPWQLVEVNGTRMRLAQYLASGGVISNNGCRVVRLGDATSQRQGRSAGEESAMGFPYSFKGKVFRPSGTRGWSTTKHGMDRAAKAQRLCGSGNTLSQVRYFDEFPYFPVNADWADTGVAGFTANKVYVVQTAEKVIQRCILMTTDAGDLVLDPTCGSGTTAYVAEQWGRRWITIDTSRVSLALARARIMGARYSYYLLADSQEGLRKEAEVTRSLPSSQPTRGDIRQGFVYERVPHITLKSIANNAEIDVIWEKHEQILSPLREQLRKLLSIHKSLATDHCLQEWEIPREKPENWPPATTPLLTAIWEALIARQREIDASIAARAESEYLYDKPYVDNKKVRVAGPFTVESLSPHRVLGVDEDDGLIDGVAESGPGYGEERDFAQMILENLKTAGVQQAHKDDKIVFTALAPWPGEFICAEGRYEEVISGEWPVAGKDDTQATSHQPLTTSRRAAIFIGPEFGTVSRPDLVEAAREAADAGFDVLIACAFNYDAHSTEFAKLGRVPVLKARMNADLHMADDLKNTGKGNLFVIFGEPDISVTSGLWLVTRDGRMVAQYECVKELSGLGSLEEINRLGGADLPRFKGLSGGRAVRTDQSIAPGGGVVGAQALAGIAALKPTDFPLTLTTSHYTQITVHGVDVFHPNTGEVRSDGPDGIACWFIDTDYNQESFFVRHAYFLGANDPYSALKTTLKAEINEDAWATLHSDTSRPFDKPTSGRIAVKVINHLGDEVMKVFRV
jgi:adenine-specific DNA-methyltransferase